MPHLQSLAQLSARIGSNPLLIQGAGGNTSIKIENTMWVKASGLKLANALKQQLFVPLNLSGLRRRLAAGEFDVTSPEILEYGNSKGLRPSIETTLHALMPHRVVLHVHSVNVIAFAIRRHGKQDLIQPLTGLRWAWVPYARPGLPLTRNVEVAIANKPDILVLANHGLVLGADSIEEAESLLYDIESRLNIVPRVVQKPDLPLLQQLVLNTGYKIPGSVDIHALATDSTCLAAATTRSLYPDHVVFLGPGPLLTISKGEVSAWLNMSLPSSNHKPAAIIIANIGVIVRNDISDAALEMLCCLVEVLVRVDSSEQLVFLSDEEEHAIVGWDAEKYRQTLSNAL